MSGWGINPNAPKKEKIKSELADSLHGFNSTGKIPYCVYSELFDTGMVLLDEMYALGQSEPLTQPEPLSPETLKQMATEPLKHWVWIENITEPDESAYLRTTSDHSGGKSFCCGYPGMSYAFKYENYGKTWLAFDRKPEEGHDG